jgi:hypothetical protein
MGTPEYDQLADLVGADKAIGESATPPPGVDESRPAWSTDPAGPTVTLSWLSQDVTVWRLDRVYLTAEGGPWISSQTLGDGADPWAEAPLWHSVAANGKELSLLLDQLGVGLENPAAAPITAAPSTAAPSAAAPSVTAPQSLKQTAGSGGWLWGPLGVLLGVGLTLAAVRWRSTTAPDGAADNRVDESLVQETWIEAMDDDNPAEPARGPVPADESSRPRTETLSSSASRR